MTNRTPIAFYVRGRGEFPFDMLRYDACYPCGPCDVDGLYGTWRDSWRTMRLIASRGTFTPARWASFGWSANEENIWADATVEELLQQKGEKDLCEFNEKNPRP